MELVSLKRNLLAFNVKASTISELVTKIQAMNGFSTLRNDIELTLYCCNVVENIVEKDHNLDKKAIVLEILTTVFGLTHEEQVQVKNQIDFLCKTSKVKSIKLSKKMFLCVCDWMNRKLL